VTRSGAMDFPSNPFGQRRAPWWQRMWRHDRSGRTPMRWARRKKKPVGKLRSLVYRVPPPSNKRSVWAELLEIFVWWP
jgi:hypothetical protein